MKRIAIYHYQYFRGACKICYRHFINEMLQAYEECHKVAIGIYGEDCEFQHYTDFGQYDSDDTDRPSFHRMIDAIEKGAVDVVMCNILNNITTNEKQLIAFYKMVRGRGLDFITAKHGLDAMKYIDIFIEKNNLQLSEMNAIDPDTLSAGLSREELYSEKNNSQMDTILSELRKLNLEKNLKADEGEQDSQSADSDGKPLKGIYRCRVCGYIFNEAEEGKPFTSLEECPVCHVDRFGFQQIR